MKVSQSQVIAALRKTGTNIPDNYFLCSAAHESNFTVDQITDEGNGTRSLGLYQIREGSSPNLLTLDGNTRAMVDLTERNRSAILAAIGHSSDPWDMGAYLSIAHNQGLGAALKTIGEYGMDFNAYAQRNAATLTSGFNGPRIVARGWNCNYSTSNNKILLLGVLVAMVFIAI